MDGTVSMEAGSLEQPGGSETVLVAEDNPAVRKLVRDILVLHGYTVMCAADGYECLRLAQGHSGPIDLLLTDVEMPGMHGPELARRLAALRSGIKVLYLSGRPVRELGERGLLDLQAHFLPKPFRVEGLARKVRDVLDDTRHDRAVQGGPQATAPG
jgi:two-component system, cell cycle sensor histidine kinase and response regulator CckA